MYPLQISRRGRGDRCELPQAFLSTEYRYGLAPQKCDVGGAFIGFRRNISSFSLTIRLTALFLATKTCNFPISLEVYTKHIPKTEPSDVLDLEFLVAQSLAFEFNVWHAHRALWGIWLDIQVCIPLNASERLLTYGLA